VKYKQALTSFGFFDGVDYSLYKCGIRRQVGFFKRRQFFAQSLKRYKNILLSEKSEFLAYCNSDAFSQLDRAIRRVEVVKRFSEFV